ncbi:lipocalin family protein [Deinococcus hopiensis]|uniref:Predicted secreted hydrolase n=1 Tax=Deinococcus hopiensis KR-140 TaxID=695939 RepID=A0A1W1VJ08_9DEIO|nr:lipocalin family protein [Deinococcus hopiensis]SMB93031.1 Predicted secreted hydrolase [Deinococcus hopiensis KR-140]
MRHSPMLAATLVSVLLTSCLPAPQAFDPARQPGPNDLGAHNAATEWWYASGYLPESGLAFHWAQFKVNYRGIPYHAGHLAVADLRNKKLSLFENGSQRASFSFPPLKVRQGDWQLLQGPDGSFHLNAGPLDLTLRPQKPLVAHPPGYSGTPEVGRLYYQSVTRLDASGTVKLPGGELRQTHGQVWLDHQWGDQQPGAQAKWDWFGLHLSDGSDLMLYRVRNGAGQVVQVAASLVDPAGVAQEVPGVTMMPGRVWRSPSGREYVLGWEVKSPALSLTLEAARDDQELLTKNTSIAYWEGPVRGQGEVNGQAVTAEGMGEFIGGVLTRAEGGRFGPPGK